MLAHSTLKLYVGTGTCATHTPFPRSNPPWVCCSPRPSLPGPADPRIRCPRVRRCRIAAVVPLRMLCCPGSATSALTPRLRHLDFAAPAPPSCLCVVPLSRPRLSRPTSASLQICIRVFAIMASPPRLRLCRSVPPQLLAPQLCRLCLLLHRHSATLPHQSATLPP